MIFKDFFKAGKKFISAEIIIPKNTVYLSSEMIF